MARINLGVNAAFLDGNGGHILGMEFTIGAGLGPTSLTFRPGLDADGERQGAISLERVVMAIAKLFDIPDLEGVVAQQDNPIWGDFFKVAILPELTIVVAPQASSIQARFQLYTKEGPDGKYGITFSDYLPSWLTIEPDITLFDLIVGYWQETGLDLRARVKIPPQKSAGDLPNGSVLLGAPEAKDKTEIIKYPFPTPSEGGQTFRVNYLGLGQRFGPPQQGLVSDPIAKIFDELITNLRSNDPSQLLETLVKDYYRPERNWFIAADIYVKGWQVQAIFNDPDLYGIRITCDVDQFDGLKFEILYQRLGPDLAVYYGGLTLPEKFRQINLGAVALTLPSFEIWIYTNGDFKVSVGWPLGPNSIGFEIYIFIGGCAFYFGKLRSGIDPRAPDPDIYYEPILTFGLALKIGVGRSIRKGVFQAELSLTLQGVFQGILAWQGVKPAALHSPDPKVRLGAEAELAKSGSLSRAPDYYWFSATIGIVGLLEGSIDLKILKVTVTIRLSVTVGIAFETDYGTVARITAEVSASAKVKILFVTIKASFSATIREDFNLSTGALGQASIEGPQNPNFQGIVPGANQMRLGFGPDKKRIEYSSLHIAQDASAAPITIHMALLPSAVYKDGVGTSMAVAIPMIGSPNDTFDSDYNTLLVRLARWLLRTYSADTNTWAIVVEKLGQGSEAPPTNFVIELDVFLADEFNFQFVGIDMNVDNDLIDLSPLPMFPTIRMHVTGQTEPIVFDDAKTPAGYEDIVREYFQSLSLSGLTSNPAEPVLAQINAKNTGPSMAQIAFQDYYMMVSRDLARRLLDEEEQSLPGEIMPEDLDESVNAQAVNVAGMASQTSLGGVLMPSPSEVGVPVDQRTLGGLYALTLQQFAVDQAIPVNEATFSVIPDPSNLSRVLETSFTDNDVIARIPVALAPASPAPIWSDLGASNMSLASSGISVTQISAITSTQLWLAARDMDGWQDDGTLRRVLWANPELQSLATDGPLKLLAQMEEPKENSPPIGNLETAPCLFIQIPIKRVALNDGGHVDADGKTTPELLSNVYQISTTDDITRARIGKLLDASEKSGISLALVYNLPDGGYETAPTGGAADQTFMFKTNLSTLTQPDNLTQIKTSDLGQEKDSAPISDLAGFLRLIWEASVVNTSGFFLSYEDAEGNGLPDSGDNDIFGNTNAATITIVARSETNSDFKHYHNVLQLPELADNTVFIAPHRNDGTAIVSSQSAYPVGCVGFELVWSDAASLAMSDDDRPPPYAESTIASLYEFIQYRVEKSDDNTTFTNSLWSMPLLRTDDSADGVDTAGHGSYRNVAPVYKFAQGGVKNVYDAIGKTPKLSFRILDNYGNILESTTHKAPFPALYNDPLIPVGEWPGVRAAYFVFNDHAIVNEDHGVQGDKSIAAMALSFDPSEIVREDVHDMMALSVDEEAPGLQQARIAYFRYGSIIAQLEDPNVEAEMFSTLFGTRAPLGENNNLKENMLLVARQISDALAAYITSSTSMESFDEELFVYFDPTQLVKQTENIFPISFEIELRRTAYVDPEAIKKLPSVQKIAWSLPPDLNRSPTGEVEADETKNIDLRAFAVNFARAFEGFDGSTGRLRLATRNGDSDFAATDKLASLYGIRWSETAGFHIEFEKQKVAYFTMIPITTKLVNQAVSLTVYGPDLKPFQEARTFSNIDADTWGRGLLSAMDMLMSPSIASRIVAISPAIYAQLAGTKRLLAETLRESLDYVYDLNEESNLRLGTTNIDQNIVRGDIIQAKERFEQHVLSTLSSAYDGSVIMQCFANIVDNLSSDIHEEDRAPRLFGGSVSSEDGRDSPYSISNARVAMKKAMDDAARPMSFLVSAVNPAQSPYLDIENLVWRAGFIEHQLAPEHAIDGYLPSSWLRIIESDDEQGNSIKTPPLFEFEVGNFRAPSPVISYPMEPVLEQQQATQDNLDAVQINRDDIFDWTYSTNVRKAENNANDTLNLKLMLNERNVTSKSINLLVDPDVKGSKGEVPPLFATLANFTVNWPMLSEMVGTLSEDDSDQEPSTLQILETIHKVIWDATAAWARFRGVAVPGEPQAVMDVTEPVPEEKTISYSISYEKAFSNDPHLIVSSSELDLWPTINGQTGETYSSDRRSYKYDNNDGLLVIKWAKLNAFDIQTGRQAANIQRNSNISDSGVIPINPLLIYETPATTFANPVIPLLRIKSYGEAIEPEATFAATLEKTLTKLLMLGVVSSETRIAKIETSYRYQLLSDPRRDGIDISSDSAILLSEDLEITSADGTGSSVTVKVVSERISEDVTKWMALRKPPTENALIVQGLSVFAEIQGQKLPILKIDKILYSVDPTWF